MPIARDQLAIGHPAHVGLAKRSRAYFLAGALSKLVRSALLLHFNCEFSHHLHFITLLAVMILPHQSRFELLEAACYDLRKFRLIAADSALRKSRAKLQAHSTRNSE